jgi:hypothetical protein
MLTPQEYIPRMKLPESIRQRFRQHGRAGGRKRAARLGPAERTAIARRAATARWIRERFGAARFEELGFPGGEVVDAGLADLASGKVSLESLLVSLAAPRLRREGIPVAAALPDPEDRLHRLLTRTSGDLAHARYGAYLRQISSFADAARAARLARGRRAR